MTPLRALGAIGFLLFAYGAGRLLAERKGRKDTAENKDFDRDVSPKAHSVNLAIFGVGLIIIGFLLIHTKL